jgi:hypothetical protein
MEPPEQFFKYLWLFKKFSTHAQKEGTLPGAWRITQSSLSNGINLIYAGKDNPKMAEMIYFYLSSGKTNCEIKFSFFIRRFIVLLEGSDW